MKTRIPLLSLILFITVGFSVARAQQPLAVSRVYTAHDLLTKIYGICPISVSEEELCKMCRDSLNLAPSQEKDGLWLDSEDGYEVCYSGMIVPIVSAIAQMSGDRVERFIYFFQFPYTQSDKESINLDQADFCGIFLQELQDKGANLASSSSRDSLFEVSGSYGSSQLDLTLEDTPASGPLPSQFILTLTVTPVPTYATTK